MLTHTHTRTRGNICLSHVLLHTRTRPALAGTMMCSKRETDWWSFCTPAWHTYVYSPRSDGMVLEKFGWFGGILEEFVWRKHCSGWKKKRIKPGSRARERSLVTGLVMAKGKPLRSWNIRVEKEQCYWRIKSFSAKCIIESPLAVENFATISLIRYPGIAKGCLEQ